MYSKAELEDIFAELVAATMVRGIPVSRRRVHGKLVGRRYY